MAEQPNVSIRVTEQGAKETAKNIAAVGDAAAKTASQAQKASQATKGISRGSVVSTGDVRILKDMGDAQGDMNSGLSGLTAITSIVSPRLGQLVSILVTMKFALLGAGKAAVGLGAALKGILVSLLHPAILGAAAVIGGIAIAWSAVSSANEEANRLLEIQIANQIRLRKEVEATKKAQEGQAKITERAVGQRIAGLGGDVSRTQEVIDAAAQVERAAQVPPEVAIRNVIGAMLAGLPLAQGGAQLAGAARAVGEPTGLVDQPRLAEVQRARILQARLQAPGVQEEVQRVTEQLRALQSNISGMETQLQADTLSRRRQAREELGELQATRVMAIGEAGDKLSAIERVLGLAPGEAISPEFRETRQLRIERANITRLETQRQEVEAMRRELEETRQQLAELQRRPTTTIIRPTNIVGPGQLGANGSPSIQTMELP